MMKCSARSAWILLKKTLGLAGFILKFHDFKSWNCTVVQPQPVSLHLNLHFTRNTPLHLIFVHLLLLSLFAFVRHR